MYKNIGEITTEDFNMIDIVIQFYLEQLGRNKNTINVSEKLKLYYSKNKELKESDMILKNFINDVVKSTIFLRNEFKKINNTLFLKIFNIGINENSIYNLLDKQNINAIFEKYSESLYFNFDTINTYIKNLVEKVTTELLQYIDKFRELKLTIPCDFNILQYRITNMSQLISFDLFNKYVFYQENDQNYLFSISEITKIMSSSKINPFTNQPFSQIFEKTFTQFFVKNNKNQENSKSHFVNSFNDSTLKISSKITQPNPNSKIKIFLK